MFKENWFRIVLVLWSIGAFLLGMYLANRFLVMSAYAQRAQCYNAYFARKETVLNRASICADIVIESLNVPDDGNFKIGL